MSRRARVVALLLDVVLCVALWAMLALIVNSR